jgi:hypothetical protein
MRLLIFALLLPITANAAPFVVSDMSPQLANKCGIVLDTSSKVESDTETVTGGKRCKYDISGVLVGQHTIKASYISIDPVWGRAESAYSAPLVFTRPVAATPVAPTGLVLTPQ